MYNSVISRKVNIIITLLVLASVFSGSQLIVYGEESEPVWVEGRYFPWFPSTDKVYAIDVDTPLKDWVSHASRGSWRIDQSATTMTALTLVGMQGVINRNTPEVYLIWDNDFTYSSSRWLEEIDKHVEVTRLDISEGEALQFLLEEYGSRFNGLVIYDPDVPDTINLATMIAGLENRIIVAPDQLELEGITDYESRYDLRDLVEEQEWDESDKSKYKIYEWVYENLWLDLDHRIIGIISPGPPTSVNYELDRYLPLGLAARDYMVALKIPIIWLSPEHEPEKTLFEKFLSEAPNPIPVLGFYANSETPTVQIASRHGDWVPVITNANGPIDGGSLTVLSAVRPEIVPFEANFDTDRMFAAIGDTPVISVWHSDGDSILVNMWGGWREEYSWGPETQDHLYSLQINPTYIDLAPVIWNYYTEGPSGASRDLISGASGCGYSSPTLMTDEQLAEYLSYASTYLEATGLRTTNIDRAWVYQVEDSEPLAFMPGRQYYEGLKEVGFLGGYIGRELSGKKGLGFFYDESPTPFSPPMYWFNSEADNDWVINDLKTRKPGEIFINLPAYREIQEVEIVDDPDAFRGQAIYVPKDAQRSSLILTGPESILPPGTYEATFRLKVTENNSEVDFGQIYVIHQVPQEYGEQEQWITLENQILKPSDFDTAGEYQNFTLEFTLDNFALNILLLIDCDSTGSREGYVCPTDLYADYIRVLREDTEGVPNFGNINVDYIDPYYEPEQSALTLIEAIIDNGFTLLNPDEYMASLNPEFMLEWATEILGNGNAELDLAGQQLEEGKYFDSLVTIRKALKILPEKEYRVEIPEDDVTYTATIVGNSWIDPLEYIVRDCTIKLATHGPPEGTATITVAIPNKLQTGDTVLILDGEAYAATIIRNETNTSYSLEFIQGPHTVEVVLPLNKPPEAAFAYSNEESTILDDIMFNDLSSDPEDRIASHMWDFGDGSTSTETDPVHKFSEKGSYTVTLTVTDDEGLTDTFSQSILIVNAAPTADFTITPTSPKAGETVEFSDKSTDPDGDPLQYLWDFGDGFTSTLMNPQHAYSTTGEMKVSLRVVDTEGCESEIDKNITISQKGIPGFPYLSIILGLLIALGVRAFARSNQKRRINFLPIKKS
jgi:PKD repeat protein